MRGSRAGHVPERVFGFLSLRGAASSMVERSPSGRPSLASAHAEAQSRGQHGRTVELSPDLSAAFRVLAIATNLPILFFPLAESPEYRLEATLAPLIGPIDSSTKLGGL